MFHTMGRILWSSNQGQAVAKGRIYNTRDMSDISFLLGTIGKKALINYSDTEICSF